MQLEILPPSAGARQGQSVAGMAEGLQAGLRSGRSGGAIRRRPAHLSDHREKFVGDENGHVKELHIYDVEWARNEQGAFVPKRVPNTEKVLPAELVLLAMGFLGPEDRC